jgi:hypothetical protein
VSNSLVNNMRTMQLPPIAKTVLWVLCDVSNDKGETFNYAPLSRLIAETCYKRDAVIRALAWLESVSLITANRENGRKTTYKVTLDSANFEKIKAEVNRKKIAQSRTMSHCQPVDQNDQSMRTTSRPERKTPVDQNVRPVDQNLRPVDQNDTNPIIPTNPKEQPYISAQENPNIPFNDFWFLYDKQVSLYKAAPLWIKLSDSERELIMAYLPNYIESKPDKQFRKDPHKFLECRGWLDEIIPNAQSAKKQESEKPSKWARPAGSVIRTINDDHFETLGAITYAN